MERGDLSNALSKRFLITLDALTGDRPLPKKRMLKSWETVARETPIEPLALGRCWRMADKVAVRFEAVVFGMPAEYCTALEDHLDRMGAHPIAWVTGYASREALRDSLPFRPDVLAVVDDPSKSLYWGRRGFSVNDL